MEPGLLIQVDGTQNKSEQDTSRKKSSALAFLSVAFYAACINNIKVMIYDDVGRNAIY